MSRRPAYVVAMFVAVLAGVGCGDDGADHEAMRVGFGAVAAAADVDEVDGPNETVSKDISYLTGSGLVDGSPEAAADRVVSGLREAGWEVSEFGPSGDGVRLVASVDAVAAQVAVHSVVGVNEAPEGSSILQFSVASADAGLAWTPTGDRGG